MKCTLSSLILIMSFPLYSQATTVSLKSLVTLPLCAQALRVSTDKKEFLHHMQTVYRKRMKTLGMDQKTVGEALGVSGSAISKMLVGDFTPNFVQVILLIQTLGLSYEEAFPASWYNNPAPIIDVQKSIERAALESAARPDPEIYLNVQLFERVYNILLHADLDNNLNTTKMTIAIQITRALNNDNSVSDETLFATVITHLYRLVDPMKLPQRDYTGSI